MNETLIAVCILAALFALGFDTIAFYWLGFAGLAAIVYLCRYISLHTEK